MSYESELVELEQARWQQAIYYLLVKLSGDNTLDGSGCDSGDPLDVTLAEISIAFNYVTERIHRRKCWNCEATGWHADSVAPYVRCHQCGSMDTRRIKP